MLNRYGRAIPQPPPLPFVHELIPNGRPFAIFVFKYRSHGKAAQYSSAVQSLANGYQLRSAHCLCFPRVLRQIHLRMMKSRIGTSRK